MKFSKKAISRMKCIFIIKHGSFAYHSAQSLTHIKPVCFLCFTYNFVMHLHLSYLL